jgi:hypothetical protein
VEHLLAHTHDGSDHITVGEYVSFGHKKDSITFLDKEVSKTLVYNTALLGIPFILVVKHKICVNVTPKDRKDVEINLQRVG